MYGVLLLQIIFESLPLSSSGHLMLFAILTAQSGGGQCCFVDEAVYVCMHFPVLCIVGFFLWQQRSVAVMLYRRHRQLLWYSFTLSNSIIFGAYLLKKKYSMFFAIHGFVLLLVGGFGTFMLLVWLSIYEHKVRNKTIIPHGYVQRFPLAIASLLGSAQSAALLLPGLSRLAVSYTVLRLSGLAPRTGFLLAIICYLPLVVGGIAKSSFAMLFCMNLIGTTSNIVCLLSVAAIATILSYKVLVWVYTQAIRRRWYFFAWYMFIFVCVSVSLYIITF